MHLECQRAYRHRESSLGRWQTANSIKFELEELEQNLGKLFIKEFDIAIVNVRFEEPCVIVLPKKMIEAHSLDEVHDDERTQVERVVDSKTPGLNVRDGNGSTLADKPQHLNLHGNLFVSVLIADIADEREAEKPDGAVAENEPLADIISAMNKGAVKATGESIRMEGGHPLGKMAAYASVIHPVNP
jgi:hypothetical protein